MGMTPLFAPPIEPPPAGTVNPPQPFSGGAVPLIVFHDGATVWGYTFDGQRDWFIKARAAFVGMAVNNANLYVLDGHVLYQYAAETLQPGKIDYPSNAVSFGEDVLSAWESQDDETSAFEALFNKPAPSQTFSPPLCNSADGTVHVLRSDGALHSFPENLDARAGSYKLTRTGLVPDALELYLEPAASGARVCWISGGKVAVAATGELETPPQGIDQWRAQCLAAAGRQPWRALAQDFKIITPFSYGGHSGALAFYRSAGSTDWTMHFLTPGSLPNYLVNTVYGWAAPVVSVWVLTLPPAEPQQDAAGTLDLGDGNGLDVPYIQEESGKLCMYLVRRTGTARTTFSKYRLPDLAPATEWTTSWLREADRTVESVRGPDGRFPIPPTYQPGTLKLFDLVQQFLARAPSMPPLGGQPSALWLAVTANKDALGLVAERSSKSRKGPRTRPHR